MFVHLNRVYSLHIWLIGNVCRQHRTLFYKFFTSLIATFNSVWSKIFYKLKIHIFTIKRGYIWLWLISVSRRHRINQLFIIVFVYEPLQYLIFLFLTILFVFLIFIKFFIIWITSTFTTFCLVYNKICLFIYMAHKNMIKCLFV